MAKQRRIERPKTELRQELIDHLNLLESSCAAFDNGVEAEGKRIALSIRILVHEHRQSKAILAQLDLRDIRFYDSAGPINPTNLLPEHNLLRIETNGKYCRYAAKGRGWSEMRKVRFQDWWNDSVIKDTGPRYFSRRELILHVADTDGGAHVDSSLDEDYMALSRNNSLGWTYVSGGIKIPIDGRPELACMRQIAYELLCTVRDFMPAFSNVVIAKAPQ